MDRNGAISPDGSGDRKDVPRKGNVDRNLSPAIDKYGLKPDVPRKGNVDRNSGMDEAAVILAGRRSPQGERG